MDPFKQKGSNGGWFSRRCSRPATRPFTFVINPSLFFVCFLWKTTRNLSFFPSIGGVDEGKKKKKGKKDTAEAEEAGFYLSIYIFLSIGGVDEGKKKKKGKKDTAEAEEAGFEVIEDEEDEGQCWADPSQIYISWST